MENQHRIYLIECKPTGKMYVGSASFIVQRFSRHRTDLRKGLHANPHMQNAWNKYGEGEFVFRELECVLDKNDLVACEQRWIDELKPQFNVHRIAGSALGCRHSEQSKRNRSAVLTRYWSEHTKKPMSPETKAKISKAGLGRKLNFSDEHRARLSQSSTGRKLSDETKEKIRKAHLGKSKKFSDSHKAAIKAAWAKRKEKQEWTSNIGK